MPVSQEAQTFTGALFRASEANVVELPQSQAMNREAPATDLAGDLMEGIEVGAFIGRDRKDAHPINGRRPHQANRAGVDWCFCHDGIIYLPYECHPVALHSDTMPALNVPGR